MEEGKLRGGDMTEVCLEGHQGLSEFKSLFLWRGGHIRKDKFWES